MTGTTTTVPTESASRLAGVVQVKHTSGPWRVAGKATIRAGRDGWIGSVHWRNREANAHLIAAAPDLLLSLRMAETVWANVLADRHGGTPAEQREPVLNAMRAAIAKAEGRTP